MNEQKQAVVLLDMSSLVHPLFHVSSQEQPDWTSDKAVSEVRALASRFPHVAICLDKGRSFRKELSADYKANRAEKDASLIHQLRLTEEKLKADGFAMWGIDGYEADDIIASAVNLAVERDVPVVIASSDKDLAQLVCDNAGVTWMPVSGKANGVEHDEAAVLAKFGVPAVQIGDYLALLGDASDNIKGVKGCGEKTAAFLLTELGSIAEILKSPGHSKQAMRVCQFNEANPGAIALAQSLVALRTDAAIDFDAVFLDRVPDNTKTEDSMADDLTPAVPVAAPAPVVSSPVALMPGEVIVEGAPVTDVAAVEVPAATPVVAKPAADVIVGNGGALVPFNQQLEPTNLADVRTVAKWVHESKLFSAYGSPQAVFTIIAAGRELGLSTMAALRAFHVVEGKPTMSAEFIRALILNSGKAEYFRCTERTPTKATFVTKRGGAPEMSLSYTIEEATAANLVKPNSGWTKHPADMLAKTASTKLARLEYPDVTMGLYCGAEMGGDE